MLVMELILTLPVRAQQKPFSQEQVSNMVRAGQGDESGAKLIEQRGIDFAPAEDFIQTLKAAGASAAFLNALRAAKPSEPTSARKPINQVQVITLLAAQVPSHRVTMLVHERGIDFHPTDDYLREVRLAGGEDELISALKSAKVTKPATVDPATQARQAQVQQHVARGAEFMRAKRLAGAETEFRAAIQLDPQNSDVHMVLGAALGGKGDLDGALAEEREALRLNADNQLAHMNLGGALGLKGDWDGAIPGFREALRLNPNLAGAHLGLGTALGHNGDWDGAIPEFREALRLNPNLVNAHIGLSIALEQKGDMRGALGEYRAAYILDPKDPFIKQNYERLLQQVNK